MLINATYFIGEINLPGLSEPANAENLLTFITKYEKKFLQQLFGEDLYDLYVAGLAEDPVDEKWTALSAMLVDTDTKESPIANYVYYYFTRDMATLTANLGEVKPKGENASFASPIAKQVRAWNEMVDFVWKFELDTDVYPEWSGPYSHFSDWCHSREIFHKINSLGL